jgi:hypothetical protein
LMVWWPVRVVVSSTDSMVTVTHRPDSEGTRVRDELPARGASGAVKYGPRGLRRSVGTAAIASRMGRRPRTANATTATPARR